MRMKKTGFTLIELVVVIIILGILSVTAAPRFLNLQVDARNAALQGLKGAMEDGIRQAYAKAVIEGQDGASGELNINGDIIKLKYGYPINESLEEGIEKLVPALNGAGNSNGNGEWVRSGFYNYDWSKLPDSFAGLPFEVYTLASVYTGDKLNDCFVAYLRHEEKGTNVSYPLVAVVPCT